jgi:hypothetical protein
MTDRRAAGAGQLRRSARGRDDPAPSSGPTPEVEVLFDDDSFVIFEDNSQVIYE